LRERSCNDRVCAQFFKCGEEWSYSSTQSKPDIGLIWAVSFSPWPPYFGRDSYWGSYFNGMWLFSRI